MASTSFSAMDDIRSVMTSLGVQPPRHDDDDDDDGYLRDAMVINEVLDQALAYSLEEILPDAGDPPSAANDDAAATVLMMKTVEAPGDGSDCLICLDGGGDGDAWKETACGHRFHARCMERWARVKGRCPLCWRDMMLPADLLMRDLRALYDDDDEWRDLLEEGLRQLEISSPAAEEAAE